MRASETHHLCSDAILSYCSRPCAEAASVATIYKICQTSQWREAERAGVLSGTADDVRDGFIHFSTAAQVGETAARHFAGATELTLLASMPMPSATPSSGKHHAAAMLFPHLFGALPVAAVRWAKPLPLGPHGHEFPELAP